MSYKTFEKEVEEMLVNKIKFIGENEHIYIGYPRQIINEITKLHKKHAVEFAKSIIPTAEQIHNYYLEATKELHPESYNPKAQKAFKDLTKEQQFIDEFIVNKMLLNIEELGK